MPIEILSLAQSAVSDLRPLQGMPLKELRLDGSKRIADLSPLAGMKLTAIDVGGMPITDLSPLRGQPIKRREEMNAGEFEAYGQEDHKRQERGGDRRGCWQEIKSF